MAKKKEKKEVVITLENILWECRVALRGVGTTEKNRDAVIALVFLKFAGDKFESRRLELIEKYGHNEIFLEKPSFYTAKNIFYLVPTSRWAYLVSNASSDDIAEKIDKALKDIENKNKSLSGALALNLFSNLGADSSKIKKLIDNINKINETAFHEEDLIGRVYEYFLRLYAASGTKEDGEFYTPACIVKLIAEMIEPYSGVVYDPCCGSGGMFVQSLKFVEAHNGDKKNISIIGQESQPETWRLCKMNLAIRGIGHNLGDTNASSFTDDQHKHKKVDYIMANPPFNLKNWRDDDALTNDPRWSGYALPRVSNANYAWILHMISKLNVNHGIAGFLLANGALNEQDDFEIRKRLIENDKVEAIIILPRDMFYTTDIPVTLWIVNNNKNKSTINGRELRDRRHEILFMDLRTWNKNIDEILVDKGKKKKKVVLNDSQIARIKEVYNNWQSENTKLYSDIPEFCKSAHITEIEENNYSLAPSKYIEFIDHDLDIDYKNEMIRIQNQMKDIVQEEKIAQKMLIDAFRGIGYELD